MKNFAMIGAAGFIAPKHLQAIKETGNRLVAAVDDHDSVGILDRYFPDTRFFTEIERFDRHLEKMRKNPDGHVEYVTVCTPNYLHDAHCRLALRVGAHAICEKPLVISPWNLDQLLELEQEHGRRVYNVLQLRLHPEIVALKKSLAERKNPTKAQVDLTYITRRGQWYHHSWKGQPEKSGGLTMNIGIHFFDMLIWLFGPVATSALHLSTKDKMAGVLDLEGARVRWFLSVDAGDLPEACTSKGQFAYRSITIDDRELEFTGGFDNLHTKVYEGILAGEGFGIEEARPSIELVHRIRHSPLESPGFEAHSFLRR